jgi:PEP-CTERM motif
MRRIFGLIPVLALAIVSAGPTSPVQADVISGPFQTSTPIPSTLTDWSGGLTFQKFDSSLGTLTEVDLSLSGNMTTDLTVNNLNPGDSCSGNAKTELQVTIQDPGHNFTEDDLQIDALSPKFDFNGVFASLDSGVLGKSYASSNQYTAAAVLSEFTGPGTIALSASTETDTVLTIKTGNFFASQTTHASLLGSVTYHYYTPAVPAPEPSTLALVVVGAAGLLVRRWRRGRA